MGKVVKVGNVRWLRSIWARPNAQGHGGQYGQDG